MALNEDLDMLDRSIRQLQIEWEKFFGGAERKPPLELKGRVEALIRQWAYSEIRNNTERFRYQTLTSRYNTFNELWSKRLRALEEGRPVAHLPRTAATPQPPPPAAEPARAEAARATRLPAAPSSGEVRISRPEQETDAVRALFEQYVEARKRAGEAGVVRFDSFEKVIAQQATRILGQKGGQAVDFRLETKDGKVTLKARPVK